MEDSQFRLSSILNLPLEVKVKCLISFCPLDPPAGKSYEEYTADDIKKIIQDTATETAERVNQDLGVIMEDMQSDVKHILETGDTHTQQLYRLDTTVGGIQESPGQLKTDMDAVKTTLEQVNFVDLKQEVSDLKKRVEDLKTKDVE